MGLEAISRGSAYCVFVDQGAEARSMMRETIDWLGCGGVTRIFRRDATRLGAARPLEPFSLVFCDPPYDRDLAPRALTSALAGGWLASDALAVVEEAARANFAFPGGFVELERRSYGDTMVAFGRVSRVADIAEPACRGEASRSRWPETKRGGGLPPLFCASGARIVRRRAGGARSAGCRRS